MRSWGTQAGQLIPGGQREVLHHTAASPACDKGESWLGAAAQGLARQLQCASLALYI